MECRNSFYDNVNNSSFIVRNSNKGLTDDEVRDRIARSKYIHEEELNKIDQISIDLKAEIDKLISEGGVLDA
mgnify:CR=1 FL=1